jgi:hypothetical protein
MAQLDAPMVQFDTFLIHTCYPYVMTEIKVQHRSFSSFTSWLRCGKAWQLERGMQAPSDPAWWFVGGSAFHAAAEQYLLQKFAKSQDKTEEIPF